jgi:tetratricopeptide (TPR) repeat protein
MRARHLLSCLLAAVALPAVPAFADALLLKDGKTVEGDVRETDTAYEVKTPFGTLTVTKADVQRRFPPADAVAAEAEALRGVAKGMADEARGMADAKAKARKLSAAVEILAKAQTLLKEARAVYPGDAAAILDKPAEETAVEIRKIRDLMPPETPPAAQPPANVPRPPPVSGPSASAHKAPPAPDSATPVGADLLLPPPPPPSLAKPPPKEGTPASTPATGAEPPADGPLHELWVFIAERKAALTGRTFKLKFTPAGTERTVEFRDLVLAPYQRIAFLPAGAEEVERIGAHHVVTVSALELARAAMGEKDPDALLLVARLHVRLGAPEQALALYAKALEAGVKPDPGDLADALSAFAKAAADGTIHEYTATLARIEAIRAKAGNDASPGLKAALEKAQAVFADAEKLQPALKKLADARAFAERKRYDDARYAAQQVLKLAPDTPVAREAEAFLETIPHPDGRLVCGFESATDLKRWTPYAGYSGTGFQFLPTAEPGEFREGKGAARLTLGKNANYSNGAITLEMADFDEARFRALSVWVFQSQISASRMEFAFIRGKLGRIPFPDSYGASEVSDCFYRVLPMNFNGWRQVKFAASEFQQRGRITWSEVGALVIYVPSRKGFEILLDSLRFAEVEKK